jgi:hypothetical protein
MTTGDNSPAGVIVTPIGITWNGSPLRFEERVTPPAANRPWLALLRVVNAEGGEYFRTEREAPVQEEAAMALGNLRAEATVVVAELAFHESRNRAIEAGYAAVEQMEARNREFSRWLQREKRGDRVMHAALFCAAVLLVTCVIAPVLYQLIVPLLKR